MAIIKKQQVIEFMYQLTLSQYEMETLYVILASLSSYSVWEKMKDYNIEADESVDTPYELYATVRDSLGREFENSPGLFGS